MPTTSPPRQRVLDYLAEHGGAVESADGVGLVRGMAGALGYESSGGLNALLAGLERDGLVVRDVRGRRTYRVALPTPAGEAAGATPDAVAMPEADPVSAPGTPPVAKRRWWQLRPRAAG